MQLIYITLSQQYLREIKSSNKNKFVIENNRIIPFVNDDGTIDGSYVMINHKQSNQGVYKITPDEEVLKSNLQSKLFEKLKAKAGQNVMIS